MISHSLRMTDVGTLMVRSIERQDREIVGMRHTPFKTFEEARKAFAFMTDDTEAHPLTQANIAEMERMFEREQRFETVGQLARRMTGCTD